MSKTSTSDTDYPTLPPEKLLSGGLNQIRAGLKCIKTMPVLREYLAYENQHEDRTPVQEAIRMRAMEIRQNRDENTRNTGSR